MENNYRHIAETIQRHAGGGQKKMLKLSVFIDEKGRIIGKTQCEVVVLHPNKIWEILAREL